MKITYNTFFFFSCLQKKTFQTGGDREKRVMSCLKMAQRAKDGDSLVRVHRNISFSECFHLAFLSRQFLNMYLKALLHFLHSTKHRKQLLFLMYPFNLR